MQFVPALQDALAGVGGPHAELFDVAKQRYAVLRDGVADARNHRIVSKPLPFVQHVHRALCNGE